VSTCLDGNGKDGVEAIDAFVEKLEAGFDYVQGSRYIAGGRAINTPPDRKIAGRLIHAPLLSLFGRHWYTDTTNGFRAYSARYLLDPRVAPFRSVFGRYELLFYLTVRAGQLGYKVVEVPVTRAYPGGERPPTKISGFRARLGILRELVAAATGRFNPR
jgi:dolichol-phosphate mannosyltransferase